MVCGNGPRRLFSLAVGALACVALACAGGREHRSVFVTTPASGRPETCPDGAVDPSAGYMRGASAMSARCSYEDVAGGGLVQIRGKVLLESAPGQSPQPVADQVITVHRKSDGKQLGRSRTDRQGAYSVSLVASGEPLEIRVVADGTRQVLSTRLLNVPARTRRVAGIDLLLPIDARLRAR